MGQRIVTPSHYNSYDVIPTFDNETIKTRLAMMSNEAVKPKFSPTVRGYINTYALKRHKSTEVMLGKRSMYFPIFERFLAEQGLPTDLKYLPIVESALKPHAKSRVGAMGLWQFMPYTGKEYGLKINSRVDERKDPVRATKAAAQFLEKLYNRYGDWALALAAYNAGPGRVNKAIKRARSKNFWRVRKYLPKETRSYVPGFIAAAYICKYHEEHGLHPVLPDYQLQVTDIAMVFDAMTFGEISRITGTPVHIIKELNPSYKLNKIPANADGNFLILPYSSLGTFLAHFSPELMQTHTLSNNTPIPKDPNIKYETVETYYTVVQGDKINYIAKAFNCKVENIFAWNKLRSYTLQPGQVLKIYERVPAYKRPRITPEVAPISPMPLFLISESSSRNRHRLKVQHMSSYPRKQPYTPNKKRFNKDYTLYSVRRGESIKDIADKFPRLSINDILKDNNITSAKQVCSGMVLRLRK